MENWRDFQISSSYPWYSTHPSSRDRGLTCIYVKGTGKMRNEMKFIETKRNLPKRNEIETKRGKFRFFSVNFVSIYFVSFRFRFAFYRYTHKDAAFQ